MLGWRCWRRVRKVGNREHVAVLCHLVGGYWSDAVNHAVGERAVKLNPLLEFMAVVFSTLDDLFLHVIA